MKRKLTEDIESVTAIDDKKRRVLDVLEGPTENPQEAPLEVEDPLAAFDRDLKQHEQEQEVGAKEEEEDEEDQQLEREHVELWIRQEEQEEEELKSHMDRLLELKRKRQMASSRQPMEDIKAQNGDLEEEEISQDSDRDSQDDWRRIT